MKVNKQITYHYCQKCGKQVPIAGSITVRTSNPWHRYRTSGRPWQNRMGFKLCKKHFKELETNLDKLIEDF